MTRGIILFFLFLALGCTGEPNQKKSPSAETAGKTKDQEKLQSKKTKSLPKTDEDWKKKLTPKQYYICREKGTESPFSGQYTYTKDKGTYRCIACGNPLFRSDTKFDSGTGWPSFWDTFSKESVTLKPDHSHGMVRIEVVCKKCGSHLGHVFDDGPKPAGNRYCINSVALDLEKSSSPSPKK